MQRPELRLLRLFHLLQLVSRRTRMAFKLVDLAVFTIKVRFQE